MSEEEEDNGLRDLFRNKLQNSEVIPSESFNAVLMKNLARKEFLHYIPSRFNIWYLGGIVITGAALAFILVSEFPRNNEKRPADLPDTSAESQVNISGGNIVPEGSPVVNTGENKITSAPAGKNRIFSKDGSRTESGSQDATLQREVSAPQNITGKISGKDIINSQIDRKDKLQSSNKEEPYLIQPSVTSGCLPLKVKFISSVGVLTPVRWEFGDGGCSEAREPEWIFDIAGEYEVRLQITGKDGARTVSSTIINVFPKPIARFEISPEDAVIPGDEILFHNYSSGAARFKWDFGDGTTSDLYEPRHKFNKFGNYNLELVALSEYGCSDTIKLANAFAGKGCYLNFPNAFIPNPEGPSGGYYSPKSDEAAHVFHPAFAGVSDYQLKIFTRLGILIFETDDINIGWDGYFKGQLSDPGVYIWKVRGSYINGEPFTKMGDVTLLKY